MSKAFLLPTAQTRDKSAVTPEQMVKVIDEIKNDPEGFDYIILDCPAGIGRDSRMRLLVQTEP